MGYNLKWRGMCHVDTSKLDLYVLLLINLFHTYNTLIRKSTDSHCDILNTKKKMFIVIGHNLRFRIH